MGTEGDHTELEKTLRSGRFAYGGVLTKGGLQRIEWADEAAFESETAVEQVRYTAFNSIGAELVPLVAESEQPADGHESVDPEEGSHPVITTVDGAVSAMRDACVYYVLVNSSGQEWGRLRDAQPCPTEETDARIDPESGKVLLAEALIEDSKTRIASLPPELDAEDIGLLTFD